MEIQKYCCLIFTVFIPVYLSSSLASEQLQKSSNDLIADINLDRLDYLRPQEKEKIAKNGFVICIPVNSAYSPEDEVSSIYIRCKANHFPIFVTSDVALHTSHLLFDWSLRFLEASSLRQDLLNLTDTMLTQSLTYHEQINEKASVLKEAALKNAEYFNIAKYLLVGGELGDMQEDIKQIIMKECSLIDKHAGFADSPLFGYKEDYSQYIPRGHYSRSPEFERYFKAMMWYGRMGFRLASLKETQGGFALDKKAGEMETLQAILICKALGETKVKGEDAVKVWERIYETTSFFAGRSDDLSVKEYKELAEQVYGKKYSVSGLDDEAKLAEFIKLAQKAHKPKILSTLVTDVSSQAMDWENQTQSMKFMGQTFTPDSYVFQNLVYDKVKAYTGSNPKPFTAVLNNGVWFRGFPRALDFMAVIGSDTAEQILVQEKDTLFGGYKEQLAKLKKEIGTTENADWSKDLYSARIWSLKAILEKPDSKVPKYMQSQAWQEKQLNAALGSWTELKHDTILYSKQAYSMTQSAMASKAGEWIRSLPAETIHGYVEPVPELYSRISKSIEQLRLKFTSLGFPSDTALVNNFKNFEGLLTSFETISIKELSGEMLTDTEYELIENIGGHLSSILKYSHYIDVSDKFRSEMDNKMPLVADVFTEVNSNQVLEQAIGKPVEIFVIAKVDGRNKVCLGAAYSYYEFKQPMSDRLTDEKWRDMIQKHKEPSMPEWIKDISVKLNESGR
jgi:hypothetical protein